MDMQIFYEAFENSQEAILILDSDKKIKAANKTFEKLTGFVLKDIEGKTLFDIELIGSLTDKLKNIYNSVETEGFWQGELFLGRKVGISIPVWAQFQYIRQQESVLYMVTALDISQQKIMENSIDFLKNYDALTGLPNRNLLNDRIYQAVATAKRMNLKAAVLYIDIDNFKMIDDSLGVPVGDILLQKFSKRLLKIIRDSDTFARIGGDDFVVVAFGVTYPNEVLIIINRIRETLAKPFYIFNNKINLTISVGASIFPDDTDNPNKLVNYAEAALETAKEYGRNTYVLYSPKKNVSIQEDYTLLSRLGDAVVNNEFVLHYQPKVSFENMKIVGAEALIRWQHPQLGLVSPLRFIPLAETYGYIKEVGSWVIDNTFRQLSYWNKIGINLPNVSINISPIQFNDKELKDYIKKRIDKYKIDPSCIELELTESMVMKNFDLSLKIVNDLKSLNILLSLDDFGVGYSSLSCISKLPFDVLKIDRSFIMDIFSNNQNRKIINMIINLAKGLGLRVIAEGIETKEQYNELKELECDEFQGYYYSKPLTTEDFQNKWSQGEPYKF
jgi:diguanylate cyclase (GGDEF)-like protein/PAS domain S-box-containing protein